MRRKLTTLFAMAAALLAWGSGAWAGIQHTVHNLTPSSTARKFTETSPGVWSWQTGVATPDDGLTNEICIYCHTPHQADTSLSTAGVPIWNRFLSGASYTMYSSPTYDASQDTGDQPTGVSKACLSCHDGTVGINQLVNNKGSGLGSNPVNGSDTKIGGSTANSGDAVPSLGTNLTNDHPISMNYYTARSPNGSYSDQSNYGQGDAPTTAGSGTVNVNSGFWNTDASGRFSNGIRLYPGAAGGTANMVQCASHHDPHNSGNPTFLRVSNDNSAVCLTCHRKNN